MPEDLEVELVVRLRRQPASAQLIEHEGGVAHGLLEVVFVYIALHEGSLLANLVKVLSLQYGGALWWHGSL